MESIISILKASLGLFLLSITSLTQPTYTVSIVPPPSTPLPASPKSSVAPDQLAAHRHTPTPAPEPTPSENYQIEADWGGEEGFYILKNSPVEAMATKEEINQAVNAYRQAHHLNTLEIDSGVCTIATQRAEEAEVHFSHQELQEHIEKGDYDSIDFHSIGENLWQGSFSGVHIVEYAWDKSEGHRANLQGDWTKGCAGVYNTTVSFIFAN